MKRKIFSIFIISLMLMLTIPTNAYSSATDIEQSTGVMSEEEIEKKRALFDSLEQSMGKIESLGAPLRQMSFMNIIN
jgi:CHASE3 domain sensor protein